MFSPVRWLLCALFTSSVTSFEHHDRTWHTPQDTRSPQDIMVDVVNDLGLNILKIHNTNNDNNIALSPYGVASILTALLEGVKGHAALEIEKCGGFPGDRDVVRVGLRDIHRLLRSYFIPQEGFLSGLSLSSEKVILKPEYQSILRFYGFDMANFNTPIYPNLETTTPMINNATMSDEETTTETTTSQTTTTEEITTTMSTTLPTTTIPTTLPPTTIMTTTPREETTTMFPETTTIPTTSLPSTTTEQTTTFTTTEQTTTMFTTSEQTTTMLTTAEQTARTTPITTTSLLPETTTQDGTETTLTTLRTTITTAGMDTTTNTETTTAVPETTTLQRTKRSIVDYFIARYYDDHNSDLYNEPANSKHAFLVNGKYQETHVHFMTYDVVLPFYYVHNLNALALRFPLDSPKYYLLLLLPVDEEGIDKLICDIGNAVTLKQIVSHMRPTYVRAVIPSFMLRGFVILTSSLQKIGIRQIFEPRHTDFSPMTDDKDIYVTNIEQAITVMIKNYMDPTMVNKNRNFYQYGPVEFKATHPFLYFVMDSEIDVTLVAGKIVNPINSRIQ